MAHEELKKQYIKDCETHERPWELWEFKSSGWHTCMYSPQFASRCEYRRKEPPFEPEYFSGLNWRDAEKLVGKVVEFSQDGTVWTDRGKLLEIFEHERRTCRYRREGYLDYFIYIRTCPETYAHPTINIGGVELPRPETEVPPEGTKYWLWKPGGICINLRSGGEPNDFYVRNGCVHLTESRAQEWADWWENTVMAEIKK